MSLASGLCECGGRLSSAVSHAGSAFEVLDSALRGSAWPEFVVLMGSVKKGKEHLERAIDRVADVAGLVDVAVPRGGGGVAGFVFADDFPLLTVKRKLVTVRDQVLPCEAAQTFAHQVREIFLPPLRNTVNSAPIAEGADDKWRQEAMDKLEIAAEKAVEAVRCFQITKTLIDQYLGHVGLASVGDVTFTAKKTGELETTGDYDPRKTVPFEIDGAEEGPEGKTARETYKEQRSLTRAEQSVANVDQPLENPHPRAAKKGHGHSWHGYQTTDEQQSTRIRTGVAPDGQRTKRIDRASRFRSPQAEAEALGRARVQLEADLRNGKVISYTDPETGEQTYIDPENKIPERHPFDVTTTDPRGFGESAQVARRVDGPESPIVKDDEGNRIPDLVVKPQMSARVVFEYVASANDWRLLTYYPKEKTNELNSERSVI